MLTVRNRAKDRHFPSIHSDVYSGWRRGHRATVLQTTLGHFCTSAHSTEHDPVKSQTCLPGILPGQVWAAVHMSSCAGWACDHTGSWTSGLASLRRYLIVSQTDPHPWLTSHGAGAGPLPDLKAEWNRRECLNDLKTHRSYWAAAWPQHPSGLPVTLCFLWLCPHPPLSLLSASLLSTSGSETMRWSFRGFYRIGLSEVTEY